MGVDTIPTIQEITVEIGRICGASPADCLLVKRRLKEYCKQIEARQRERCADKVMPILDTWHLGLKDWEGAKGCIGVDLRTAILSAEEEANG